MAHLNREMLAVQCLHLVKGIPLQLLGLDPHSHVHSLLFRPFGRRQLPPARPLARSLPRPGRRAESPAHGPRPG